MAGENAISARPTPSRRVVDFDRDGHVERPHGLPSEKLPNPGRLPGDRVDGGVLEYGRALGHGRLLLDV